LPTGDLAAKRYAQAAFELARESNDLNEWSIALSEISEVMSNPDVARVLENTRIASDEKLNFLAQALPNVPPLALNLARLLVRKRRTRLAPEVSAGFRRLADENQRISHARAVTAVPLSDAEREALVNRLQAETGRRILLETQVDSQLLGGVVLQIGDRLIDSSTKAKLEALRQNLVGAV
jgi:F-type H+-transporting ATPase subunit delta